MNIDSRYRMMVFVAAALAAGALPAMPGKNDFVKAQPIVNELMGAPVNDFKAKKITASEVGAKAVEYAREAETEAAKFLLLKGAITYDARAEEYDKAADAVEELGRTVKDIPPGTMLDIIARATSRIGEANAPRLFAQYRLVSARAKAEREVVKLEALAAKRPDDNAVRCRYAETLAVLGNWKTALDEFAKAKGKPGEIAAAEQSGKGRPGEIAAFWWDYEPEEQYASEAIKQHAAEFYQKALAEGSLSGLKKTLAEKRIASLWHAGEPAAFEVTSEAPAVTGRTPLARRAAVASKSAPVAIKGGPWTLPKAFKTPVERSLDLGGGVTMPFCACPAGSFRMLNHKVTITRPYWISKTSVSLPQFMASPNWKAYVWQPDNIEPAEQVAQMFKDRFISVSTATKKIKAYVNELNLRFKEILPPGYVFRLPTEAEFFYAYNAGQNEDDVVLPPHDRACRRRTHDAYFEKGLIPKGNHDEDIPWTYGWMELFNLPEANAFGVVPYYGGNVGFLFLDKIECEGDKVLNRKEIISILKYAREEIDPLRDGCCWYDAGGNNIQETRRLSFSDCRTCSFVVIGPDLKADKGD